MKKTFIFVLCILFVFALISCSSEEPEIVPEFSESEESHDFGGRTIVSAVVKDYFFEGKDNTLGYINNTILADLAIARLKDVEKEYNVKLEYDYVNRAGEAAYLDVISGTGRYDYIQEETYYLTGYLGTEIFTDFSEIESLDYSDSDKWGSARILEPMMYHGGIYGVYPAYHPLVSTNSPSSIYVIDEDMISQLGVEDPRDIYERGEWTWDTFEDVLTTYTSTDLIAGQKIYALSAPWFEFFMSIGLSNCEDYIVENNGKYNLCFYTDEGLEALNKAMEWYESDDIIYVSAYQVADSVKRKDAVIYMMDAYAVLNTTSSAAYIMDNFGLVPAPTGPRVSPKTINSVNTSVDFTLCIPITAKDSEVSATILDAIYEPFEGFETKDKIDEYLCDNYFSDMRDVKIYRQFTEDMEYGYFQEAIPNAIIDKFQMGNISVVSVLENWEDKIADMVEEYVADKRNTIKELYD